MLFHGSISKKEEREKNTKASHPVVVLGGGLGGDREDWRLRGGDEGEGEEDDDGGADELEGVEGGLQARGHRERLPDER